VTIDARHSTTTRTGFFSIAGEGYQSGAIPKTQQPAPARRGQRANATRPSSPRNKPPRPPCSAKVNPDEPPASPRAPANLTLIPVGIPIVRATFS